MSPASTTVAASPTLRFSCSAPTTYGDTLLLLGSSSLLGSFETSRAIPLSFESPDCWTLHLSHPLPASKFPTYKYGIRRSQGFILWEPGPARSLPSCPNAPIENILIRDQWRHIADPIRDIFSTSAFANNVFARPREIRAKAKLVEAEAAAMATRAMVLGRGGYVWRVEAFVERLRKGDEVAVVGNVEELGAGDVERAVALKDVESPMWCAYLAFPREREELRWRLVIREKDSGKVIVEEKEERILNLNGGDREFLGTGLGKAPMVCGGGVTLQFDKKWRGSGVALPVFGVRSREGCGVGEFEDLKTVVDFCKKGGLQLLQLLPINDTGGMGGEKDSYPYSAVSNFALHPLYLRVEGLGDMGSAMKKEFQEEKDALNKSETVDYVNVVKVKEKYVRKMYARHKEEFLQSLEFTTWFEENQHWLVPYALFKFFMEVNGTSNYDQWGARKSISLEEMRTLASPDSFHFDYIGVVYYTQFNLHKQLSAAAEYASQNNVVFKGDLPIGVNRYCVDTWVNPSLFRLHMQAGAPPDFFSTHGQNWYFPTYDWEEMSKDNYGWWRSRLGQMEKYFHAYRIDHILGFFRIWEIPESFKTGMSGRFYPAHGIRRQELESLGLWDIDRYCMPYVHDGLLQEMFHEDWWKIKDKFFEPLYGRLKFKEECDTERKVEKILTLPRDAPESEKRFNKKVKEHLFTLFNNVCLLRDVEDADVFHPRFMLQQTSSYAQLPSDEWKGALYNLHEDYMHRRQDELWKKNGLERLPMMKSASKMLVCGEDLGMIPNCVPSVMDETSILSLAVQRMPPGDVEFGRPSEYKYECVATTSSHDTSTFRGWWEEISDDMRMRYWTDIMGRSGGERPSEVCSAEVAQWAIEDHLKCPAMWTIFPIQDLLAMDDGLKRKDAKAEQINDPSNPDHVWNYRMHLNIEDVLENHGFMEKIAELNRKHGRGMAY